MKGHVFSEQNKLIAEKVKLFLIKKMKTSSSSMDVPGHQQCLTDYNMVTTSVGETQVSGTFTTFFKGETMEMNFVLKGNKLSNELIDIIHGIYKDGN